MRKAIFAVLAVLGISLTATALATAANAASMYPPTQYEGNNN
jgi:hypothetical protein